MPPHPPLFTMILFISIYVYTNEFIVHIHCDINQAISNSTFQFLDLYIENVALYNGLYIMPSRKAPDLYRDHFYASISAMSLRGHSFTPLATH